jgi:hypothetical protein
MASSFWCGVSFGLRPRLLPAALARARPSPVRVRINSRSNSARPPRTVSIKRPCAEVVSAHASPSERKAGFLLGDRYKRVQQVAGRAGEAIKPRHHHHVAGGDFGEKPTKRRPVNRRAARHLAEHLARADGAKLPRLRFNALAASRDAGIAVNRDSRFRDGARPAFGSGHGGETDGASAWGSFHATDLRNTQAFDTARPGECCLSLNFCNAGTPAKVLALGSGAEFEG